MRRDATIRHRIGLAVAAGAAIAAAWAAVVWLSGGISFHTGVSMIAARDPIRPVIASVALAAIGWALLGTAAFVRALRTVRGDPSTQLPARVALLAVAATLVVSNAWNTRAAGGSDSSCYVLQADAFTQARATLPPPLTDPPPAVSPQVMAPIGFVPSPSPPHDAVPICAPGLAIVMAPARLVARDAVFLVVPLFAALAVWCTFLLGRALDGGATGAIAAALLACSPIFLYQAVQPMSDVPAAALWLAALVALAPGSRDGGPASARREVLAGLCASVAVLMRPNVALIVLPLLALLRLRLASWLRFGAASLPALGAMLALGAARYGSPFASGYGDTGVLFSLSHIAPNLARYPKWLLESHSWLVVFAMGAPWILARRGCGRLATVASAAVVLTVCTYLAYTVFDDWWYIRFLLPALPVLLVFTLICLRSVASSIPRLAWWALPFRGQPLFYLGVSSMAVWFVVRAVGGHVFDLAGLEARFRLAGEYAGRALTDDAIVFAVQQSGSVRFYGERGTLAWDALPAERLDATVMALERLGRRVFFVLEDAEESRFRAHFAGQQAGGLDWPPFAEVRGPTRVRFYDPRQRGKYLAGERFNVEIVTGRWPARSPR